VLEIAPRIPPRLLDEIERLARKREPIAEINRRVGRSAAAMGLPRPSYEQVRVLVHVARRYRREGPKSVSTTAAEFALWLQPPEAIVRQLAEGPPLRLRDRASPPK
jgi:hypothetical protein